MNNIPLTPQPLTAAVFAPFGDVIEAADNADFISINDGNCKRYDDLARIQHSSGEATISIFCADTCKPPFDIHLLERHPLATQAFIPLGKTAYWVIVAPNKNDQPDWDNIRVFTATTQGINFHVGVWHHPLFVVGTAGDFLVVDRANDGADNCEIYPAPANPHLTIAP